MDCLSPPLLFFLSALLSSHPKAAILAAIPPLFGDHYYQIDDRFVWRWIEKYNPPNHNVLWLTNEKVKGHIPFVKYPKFGEAIDPAHIHRFGLVIIEPDYPTKQPTWYLEYCWDALVDSGWLLILDGREVVIHVPKNPKIDGMGEDIENQR